MGSLGCTSCDFEGVERKVYVWCLYPARGRRERFSPILPAHRGEGHSRCVAVDLYSSLLALGRSICYALEILYHPLTLKIKGTVDLTFQPSTGMFWHLTLLTQTQVTGKFTFTRQRRCDSVESFWSLKYCLCFGTRFPVYVYYRVGISLFDLSVIVCDVNGLLCLWYWPYCRKNWLIEGAFCFLFFVFFFFLYSARLKSLSNLWKKIRIKLRQQDCRNNYLYCSS